MSVQTAKRRQAVIAWVRLIRIYQRLGAAGERNFKPLGLNTAWFDVLARVRAREGITQGELAASLLVTKGNVSQLLAKMESDGLVAREADGRRRLVRLTPRGRELADQAVPLQETLIADSLAELTGDERTELERLLKKWAKSLKEKAS